MKRITNFDLIKTVGDYFELPTEEKEYLQHYLWDLVQDYRSDLINTVEMLHHGRSIQIYSTNLKKRRTTECVS